MLIRHVGPFAASAAAAFCLLALPACADGVTVRNDSTTVAGAPFPSNR